MPPNPPSNSHLPRLAVWSGYGTEIKPPCVSRKLFQTLTLAMAVQKGEKKQERGRSKDESLTNIHLSIFLYLTQNLFTIGYDQCHYNSSNRIKLPFYFIMGPK